VGTFFSTLRTRSTAFRLDEDVYERLKSEKRDDETFSEVVNRLIGDWSLLDLAGTATEAETARHREILEAAEQNATQDREGLLEQFGIERE
jgi:predicted CopG family antitoxin